MINLKNGVSDGAGSTISKSPKVEQPPPSEQYNALINLLRDHKAIVVAKGNAGKLKYQKKMNKYLALDSLMEYRMEHVFENLTLKEREEM